MQEGLELLKSHMHKNGFVHMTQIVWGGIALVAVTALVVFFVIRARRAKRKAASACTAPDDLKITEASE